LDAKITDRIHWLDDVGADCPVQLAFWNFTKDLLRTKPDEQQQTNNNLQKFKMADNDYCGNELGFVEEINQSTYSWQ